MSPLPGLGLFAFAGAAGGDYESIQTVTVGSGGASSISFTSIPSTYKHLQIRGIATPSVAANLRGTFNNDTANNYAYHYLSGDGSTAAAGNGSTALYAGYLASATYPSAFVIDVLDYANTSKNKTLRSLFGVDVNGAGGYVLLTSSLWTSTSAINQFTLYPQSGSFAQYSSFALYGIKG